MTSKTIGRTAAFAHIRSIVANAFHEALPAEEWATLYRGAVDRSTPGITRILDVPTYHRAVVSLASPRVVEALTGAGIECQVAFDTGHGFGDLAAGVVSCRHREHRPQDWVLAAMPSQGLVFSPADMIDDWARYALMADADGNPGKYDAEDDF